jgi:hypothetical protein
VEARRAARQVVVKPAPVAERLALVAWPVVAQQARVELPASAAQPARVELPVRPVVAQRARVAQRVAAQAA